MQAFAPLLSQHSALIGFVEFPHPHAHPHAHAHPHPLAHPHPHPHSGISRASQSNSPDLSPELALFPFYQHCFHIGHHLEFNTIIISTRREVKSLFFFLLKADTNI